ncbi:HpcH/HpaI aldolase family protein [Azospirillum canadense]|uniref:HpcH/HpaI aldolase family protein n=1 Tax=Azospirillum canadense TaxID=403962 RepID=UPI0022260734|nr:aldolase/citrate lyase family protein [Azospirillum canadense]MCW2238791.1 2-keto-3-deoxy-L-rhamnonate aldolase RhmA [Azospirillum canadense]
MSTQTERPSPSSFRRRLLGREPLLGTFIKTPSGHAMEIFGDVGFDFAVIDAEHAPFDRASIDTVLMAARAGGIAGLIRVAEPSPAQLLAALDDGAAGVLVPHVSSAEAARAAVAACRYRGGRRGFSNSPRAGRYGGLAMWPHVDAQDASVAVIAMIEDPEALDVVDAILATDGLDAIFIGRADLTVALGAASPDAPEVRSAVDRILAAARAADKPVCLMVASAEEARSYTALGASAFMIGSDQGLMRQAATKHHKDFATLKGPVAG